MNESLSNILSNLPDEQTKELIQEAVKKTYEVGTTLGKAVSNLIDRIFD